MKRLPKGFGSVQTLSRSRRKPYAARIWNKDTARYTLSLIHICEIVKALLPLLIATLIALMIITYVPEVSLFIPRLFGATGV